MSLQEKRELALRARACDRWRWMPGMVCAGGDVVIDFDGDLVIANVAGNGDGSSDYWIDQNAGDRYSRLPDLDNPATLGHLRALVCEAHHCASWIMARLSATELVAELEREFTGLEACCCNRCANKG